MATALLDWKIEPYLLNAHAHNVVGEEVTDEICKNIRSCGLQVGVTATIGARIGFGNANAFSKVG